MEIRLMTMPAIHAVIRICLSFNDNAIITGERSNANTTSTPANLTELVTVMANNVKKRRSRNFVATRL